MTDKVTLRLTLQVEDESIAGSVRDLIPDVTKEWSGLTVVDPKKFSVTQNTTVTVWDPVNDNDPVTTFTAMILLAIGGDLRLEATCGEGEATEELFAPTLANGVPYVLGSQQGYRDHSASDAFAGTLDVIDKLRVQEPNVSAVTLWRILLA